MNTASPQTTAAEDPLLTPAKIGGVALDNRAALAPMMRVSAREDGSVTDRNARYYAGFARGGFGLIITEGTYTDTEHSQGYLYQPGLAPRTRKRRGARWSRPCTLRTAHSSPS